MSVKFFIGSLVLMLFASSCVLPKKQQKGEIVFMLQPNDLDTSVIIDTSVRISYSNIKKGLSSRSFILSNSDNRKKIENNNEISFFARGGSEEEVKPGDTVLINRLPYFGIKYSSSNRDVNRLFEFNAALSSIISSQNVKLVDKYRLINRDMMVIDTVNDYRIEEDITKLLYKQIAVLDSLAPIYGISEKEYQKKLNNFYTSKISRYFFFYECLNGFYSKEFFLEKLKGFLIKYRFPTDMDQFEDYHFDGVETLYDIFKRFDNSYDLSSSDAYKLIKQNFTGSIKEYLIYKVFLASINKRKVTSRKMLREIKKDIHSKYFYGILKSKNLAAKKILRKTNKPNIVLSASDLQPVNFEKVLKSERGNVLLLDFWATWCQPCNQEMPELKKLKDLYKDKNFKIIAFGFDGNTENWVDFLKLRDVNYADHYLITQPKLLDYNIKYKISTIPRYILIAPDGAIISSDAPSPSDPELRAIIEKHLSSQK